LGYYHYQLISGISHIIRISLCQSLNFSHQKGGVGKSLLSYHLAYLLKDNYDVQLLDLDNQKSLSSIHKLRNHKLQGNTLSPSKLFTVSTS